MLFHHARYLAMATVCIVRYLWVYTVYMSDYWQAWRLSNILPCNSSSDSFLATMPAPPSSYKSLIKTSLKVGGYSELLHMYAASAAFGIVIQSRLHATQQCDWHRNWSLHSTCHRPWFAPDYISTVQYHVDNVSNSESTAPLYTAFSYLSAISICIMLLIVLRQC